MQMISNFHERADEALRSGNLREALGWLEKITAQQPKDFEAYMKLATLRRANSDPAAALIAVNAALGVRPNEFIALLLKGLLHEQLGEVSRAAEVYRATLFHAEKEPSLPDQVRLQLERIRAFLATLRDQLVAKVHASCHLDPQHQNRLSRFIDNVHDRRPVYHQEPTHYRYPGLADVEFFDHAYPDLRERLHQAWPDIRDEYLALAERRAERKTPYVDFAPGQPMGPWKDLNRSAAWNVFHLIRYGEPDPINAGMCPRTIEALAGPDQADVPGITPNLLFSLLAPQTRIPPHHGVANFRTLLHLPLIVPEGCGFRVGSETREWKEGEPWIFDDTIEHEAWNNSDKLRVVLIADLWRPELDEQDRTIVRTFVQAQASADALGVL